jgi:hypothetical protein
VNSWKKSGICHVRLLYGTTYNNQPYFLNQFCFSPQDCIVYPLLKQPELEQNPPSERQGNLAALNLVESRELSAERAHWGSKSGSYNRFGDRRVR